MAIIAKNGELEIILKSIEITRESLTPSERDSFSFEDWKHTKEYNKKIGDFLDLVIIYAKKNTKKKVLKEAKKHLQHFKNYLGIYRKGQIQLDLLKKHYL